jgi:hypothetical protein
MSRIARIAVLVTALASLFAVLSSTAGAVTFTNSGSTAFTATGGPFSLSVNSGANSLACTASSATGTVASGAFTAILGSLHYSPCTFIGQSATLGCTYTLTPISFTSGVVQSAVDVHCIYRLVASGSALCNVTGSTPATYVNPIGAAKGRLTLLASSTLVVSNNSDASCSALGIPTGTTRVGSLTAQTIAITNGTPTTLGPVITSP